MKTKTLLFVVLATLGLNAVTTAQNLPNYVPSNGLVGWWPFDGNANDESLNGNNGIVYGPTLTSDRFGNDGKAYSFDGANDYITVHQELINYSVSLWFKPISFTNQFNDFYHYENTYAQITNDSTVYARAQYATPPSIGVITDYKNNLGEWHHLVVTYNAQNSIMNVYIDNVNHFTSTPNSEGIYHPEENNDTMYFGGYFSQNINYFNGIIDDIGTWNRELTEQEISELFNGNICYQTITVTDTLLINTGIVTYNPVTYNNTIKIFPNPTNDHITIDYGNFTNMNGYQLRIENSLGQEVFQTSITQQSDYLNLTTWGGNGLYFVHIIDEQGNTIDIKKIVLQ
jgi:hypothetical protein